MGWTHLRAAVAVLEHPTLVAKGMEQATRRSANAARRAIRHEAPLAKATTHLSGTHHRGQARGRVNVMWKGHGFNAEASVRGGRAANLIVPGQKMHDIAPATMKALSFGPAAAAPGLAPLVHHPAVAPNPFVERGAVAAGPLIDAVMAETGQTIVTEMARSIERGR